jgi:hypothetical protein
MKMRQTKSTVLTIIFGFGLTAHAAIAANLAADYQLQGVYDSSVGTIHALAPVGTATDLSFNTNQTVDGLNQTVLNVNINTTVADTGAGVQSQTAGFLSSSNYSIVLLADFNLDTNLVATKVFDFDNLSSDAGLYINDVTGVLYFNGATGATGTTTATTNTYTQIVLTRDSTSDLVTVYQDGIQDFQFNDSTGLAIMGDSTASGNAFLSVFKDDSTGVGSTLVNETTVGNIARLRLYDGVLTPTQVASLDTVVPEPLSSSMMLMGSLLLLKRSRR